MRMMIGNRTRGKAKRRQSGFGLLEIALGLGVAAIAVAAAVMLYSSTTQKSTANQISEDVVMVMNLVDRMWGHRSDFRGVERPVLINSGYFPDRMIVDSMTLLHAGGGRFMFEVYSDGCSGCLNALAVIPESIKTDACKILVSNPVRDDVFKIAVGEYGARVTFTRPFDGNKIGLMRNACETADGDAAIEYHLRK
jgi:Tfp pilus assembly protein PilW